MVVDDFDLARPRIAFRPFETNPLLVVDANAVLPLTTALERFQPVARKAARRLQMRGRFQPVEALFRLPPERLESRNTLALSECAFACPGS
jgi:hypothetical protein